MNSREIIVLGSTVIFKLNIRNMKKSIGNFFLDGWTPTSVEYALMNGNFDKLLKEADIDNSEGIPSDFLEVQDFNTAMDEIKNELDNCRYNNSQTQITKVK
jgi:hypothetical protein